MKRREERRREYTIHRKARISYFPICCTCTHQSRKQCAQKCGERARTDSMWFRPVLVPRWSKVETPYVHELRSLAPRLHPNVRRSGLSWPSKEAVASPGTTRELDTTPYDQQQTKLLLVSLGFFMCHINLSEICKFSFYALREMFPDFRRLLVENSPDRWSIIDSKFLL